MKSIEKPFNMYNIFNEITAKNEISIQIYISSSTFYKVFRFVFFFNFQFKEKLVFIRPYTLKYVHKNEPARKINAIWFDSDDKKANIFNRNIQRTRNRKTNRTTKKEKYCFCIRVTVIVQWLVFLCFSFVLYS